jgi:leader peptidase (prepilin peptidase)/N-methyltransferase
MGRGTKDKGARIELPPAKPAVTLSQPRSRCPHCGHQIAWYENIPVLSYLFLRGRCAECKKPISLRYPWLNWSAPRCLPSAWAATA